MAEKKIDVLLANIGVDFDSTGVQAAADSLDKIAKSFANVKKAINPEELKNISSFAAAIADIGRIDLTKLNAGKLASVLDAVKNGYADITLAVNAATGAIRTLNNETQHFISITKEKGLVNKLANQDTKQSSDAQVNSTRRETQAIKQEAKELENLRRQIREIITLRSIAAANRVSLTPKQRQEINTLPEQDREVLRQKRLQEAQEKADRTSSVLQNEKDVARFENYDRYVKGLEAETTRILETISVVSKKLGITRSELELLVGTVSKDLFEEFSKKENVFKATETSLNSIKNATKTVLKGLPDDPIPPEVQSLNAVKEVLEEIRALMLVLAKDVVSSWSSVEGGLKESNVTLLKTMLEPYEKAYDILVGNSIVPDLADRIKEILIQTLPADLAAQANKVIDSIISPYEDASNITETEISKIIFALASLEKYMANAFEKGLFKGPLSYAINAYESFLNVINKLVRQVAGLDYSIPDPAYAKNRTIPDITGNQDTIVTPQVPALPPPKDPLLTPSIDTSIVTTDPNEIRNITIYNEELSEFQKNVVFIKEAIANLRRTPKVTEVLHDTIEIPAQNFGVITEKVEAFKKGIADVTQPLKQMVDITQKIESQVVDISDSVKDLNDDVDDVEESFRSVQSPLASIGDLVKGIGLGFKGVFDSIYGGSSAPLEQLTTTAEGAAKKLEEVRLKLQALGDSDEGDGDNKLRAQLEKQEKALLTLTDFTQNDRLVAPAVAPLKIVESFGERAAKAMTIFRSETGGAFKGIQQLFYGINTPVGLFGKALDGVNQQVFQLNNGFEQAGGVIAPFIGALERSASTADNVFSNLTRSLAELNKSRRQGGLDEIQVTGVQRATTDIARELGNLVTSFQTSGEVSRGVLHNLTREIELARTNINELRRTTTDSNGNLLPGVQESSDQLDILERALQDVIIAEGRQAAETAKATSAEEKQVNVIKALLTLMGYFGSGIVGVVGKLGSLASMSLDVLKPLRAVGSVIRDIGVIAAGTFGGNLLTRAFERLSDTGRESSIETLQAMDGFRAQLRGQLAGIEMDTAKMLEGQGESTAAAMKAAQADTQNTIDGVFDYIRQVTATTPFQLSDTIDAFNRLLTAKLDPTKWITPIANAATALNVPLEQIVGAFQALTAGDTGEAIARLRDANVAVYDIGLEFNKDGSLKSGVDETLDSLYKFFTTAPAFANASAASMDTLSGAFSNLQDTLGTTGSNFLQPLSGELRKLLLNMTDTFGSDSVGEKAVDVGNKLASAFGKTIEVTGRLAVALDPLWKSLGRVGSGLGSLASGFGVFSTKVTDNLSKVSAESTKLAASEEQLEQYKEMINEIFKQMSEGEVDEAIEKLAELGLTLDDLGLKVGPDGTLQGDFEKAIEVISQTPGALKVINDVVNDTIDNMSLLEKVAFSLQLIFEGLGELFTGDFKNGLEDLKYGVAALGFVIGSALLDLGRDAYDWGANVVSAFAKGFVDIGSRIVHTAIDTITGIFAYFLQGFSPPKGDPLNKIDEWGENLAKTYAEGFAGADVSADIQAFGSQINQKLANLDVDGMQLFETIQGSLQSQLDLIIDQLDVSDSAKVAYQQQLSDAILNGIGAFNSGASADSIGSQIVNQGFAGLSGLTDGLSLLVADYFKELEKAAQVTELSSIIDTIESERDTALDSLESQYTELEDTLNQNLESYQSQAESLNEMLENQKEALDAYNQETDQLVEQAIAAKGLLVSEAEEQRAKSKLEDAQKEVKDAQDRLDSIQKRNKEQGITFATFEEINARAALSLAEQREKEAQAEVDKIEQRKEQAKLLESSIKSERQAGADALKNQIASTQDRLKVVKDQESAEKKRNQEILNAKKEEIAQQKEIYETRIKAAKDLLKAAQDEQKAIQEQIKLREQALNLQIDNQKSVVDALKPAGAGKSGSKAGEDAARVARQFNAPDFLKNVFGGKQQTDFSKDIDNAFGDVEDQFKDKFDGVVQNAKRGVAGGIRDIIGSIVDSFKNGGILGKLAAILEPFSLAIGTALTFIIGSKIIQAFETLKASFIGLAQAATGLNYTRFIVIALILAVAGILRISGDPKFNSFFKIFLEFAKTLKEYANAAFQQFVKIFKSFAYEADGSLNILKLVSSTIGALATAFGLLIKVKGWESVAGFFTRLVGLSAGFNPLIGLFTGMIVHLITMRDSFIEVINAIGDFVVSMQPAFESIGLFATAGGGLSAAIYGLINALVLGGLVAILKLLPVILKPVIEGMTVASELFAAFASIIRGDLEGAQEALERFGKKFSEANVFIKALSLSIATFAGAKGLMFLFGNLKTVFALFTGWIGKGAGILAWFGKGQAAIISFVGVVRNLFIANMATAAISAGETGTAVVGIIPKLKAFGLALVTAVGPLTLALGAAVALGVAILALTGQFNKDLPDRLFKGLKELRFQFIKLTSMGQVEDNITRRLRIFGKEIDALNIKNKDVAKGIEALQKASEDLDLTFDIPVQDLQPFLKSQQELNDLIEQRRRVIAEMFDVDEGSARWEELRLEAKKLADQIGEATPKFEAQANSVQLASNRMKDLQASAYAMNLSYDDYVNRLDPRIRAAYKDMVPFMNLFGDSLDKINRKLYEQGKAAYESANTVEKLKQIYRGDRDELAKFIEDATKLDEEYQKDKEDALAQHNGILFNLNEGLRLANTQAEQDYYNNQILEENKNFAEQEAERDRNRQVELEERKKHFAELLIQLITSETERKIASGQYSEEQIQRLRDDLADQTSAIAIANGIMTEDSVASANKIIAEYARWTSSGGRNINDFIKILKDMGYEVDEVTLRAIGLGNLSITPEVDTTQFDDAMTRLKSLEKLLGTLDEMVVSPRVLVDTVNNAVGAGKTPDSQKRPYVPALAQGTAFAPGGWALVGENGAELVYLPRGSKVFPKQTTQDYLSSPDRFAAIARRFGRKTSDRGIIDTGSAVRALNTKFQNGLNVLGGSVQTLKDTTKIQQFLDMHKRSGGFGAGNVRTTLPYGNGFGGIAAQPTYSNRVIGGSRLGGGIHIGEIVNQLPPNAAQSPERYATAVADKTGSELQKAFNREANRK